MFGIKTLIKTITLVKEENILLIYLYQFVYLYCELNPDRLITCILFGNVFVLSRLTQKTIIEWIKQIGYRDFQTQFRIHIECKYIQCFGTETNMPIVGIRLRKRIGHTMRRNHFHHVIFSCPRTANTTGYR